VDTTRAEKPSFSVVFWAGVVAGAVAGAAVTPADVIKTRIQARVKHNSNGVLLDPGIWATVKEVAKESPLAFFKGAGWRAAIISPLFAIALLTYEVQQRYLSDDTTSIPPIPPTSAILPLTPVR